MTCTHEHTPILSTLNERLLEDTVNILTAMADSARLQILLVLYDNGECCVSALAEHLNDKANTVSMRLRKLYDAGLVAKRRDAKHIYYSLKDEHVMTILRNTLEHAQHYR